MRNLIDRLSLKAIRRLIVLVIGSTVILFGIVLSLPLVPGPGFVVIFAGLAILATEFVWARVLMHQVKDRINSAVATVSGRNGSGDKAAAGSSTSSDPPSNSRRDAVGGTGLIVESDAKPWDSSAEQSAPSQARQGNPPGQADPRDASP